MSCRVLVVEDEILVAMEIENIVEDMGHLPIGVAQDSKRARELAKDAELAFVDLNLVDGPTGIELGRDLALWGVTVLYMTANPAQLGDGVPGAIGVLPKPVNDQELKQALDYCVSVRRQTGPVTPPRRLRLFDRPSAQATA
ncbi:response regulator [Devosia sp.]|uniref:response regulator n=1 Tax=Devosia sp. TaxID=1871048 RepID=UPI003BA89712